MSVSARNHPNYHWIVCSACGEEAWVPKNRLKLCDGCFTEGGNSKKVPWGEVNRAVTEYLIREGVPPLELVPHNQWKEE